MTDTPQPSGPPQKASETDTTPEFIGPRLPAAPPSMPLPLAFFGVIAVLLVLAAIGAGLAAGTIARPSPTPRPTPTPVPATPTPVPTTDPAVFVQTLSAGCATDQGVWVVTDGGGLLRYDGKDWATVDRTLRTLTNASCDAGTMYAVGPVGAVLIIDDRARQINSFDLTLADLRAIAAMPEGAITVGTGGMVQLLLGGSWQVYAQGIEEDLNAVVAFGLESAWVVGAQGASYRLEAAGWRTVPTGVTVSLRAVSGTGPQSAVAAGDAGTLLVFDGTWKPVESGVTTNLRAIARVGSVLWVVGDGGTVLTLSAPATLTRVDLGTTCNLRSVFVSGQDVWIVGSTGPRGGVWRLRDGKVAERWGPC